QETWSSSALRMHRELDLLQRWKADALTVLQKMQADVSCAQEKYREQLEQNQTLQHQLEHVGQQAHHVLAELPRCQGAAVAPEPLSQPCWC
ncbi:unnamed protein product, partial [Effrenium voratum]